MCPYFTKLEHTHTVQETACLLYDAGQLFKWLPARGLPKGREEGHFQEVLPAEPQEVGGRQAGEDDTWRGKDEPGETYGGLEHRDAEGSPFRSRGSQRRQSVESNVLQGSSERCKMLVSLALC